MIEIYDFGDLFVDYLIQIAYVRYRSYIYIIKNYLGYGIYLLIL